MNGLAPFAWRDASEIPPRQPGSSPEEQLQLRSRLAAAADYGREKIAATRSPCARDLCWYLIRLAEMDIEPGQLPREVRAAEHLWRAALELERLEGDAG